jgi:biotin transport system substrate-specific component
MAVTVTTPNTLLGNIQPRTDAARLLTNITVVILGTLLLYASAKFKLPLPPVPFTLQTLAVALIAGAAGWRIGVATVALYLIEGLAGVPVFAGDTAGPAYLLGTTGGFLIGYLPMAYVIGRAADAGAAGNVALLFVLMVFGDAIVFAFGYLWLYVAASSMVASGAALPKWLQGDSLALIAFSGAVKPFILWDLLKMAFAAMTVSGALALLKRRA